MDEVTIRPIKIDEWDDAIAVVWKTFLKFEAGDYDEEGIHSFLEFISDERLKKLFLNGEYPILAAFCEDKIVGVVAMRSQNHISLLFVSSNYHKNGIGRKLINAMKELVISEGRKDRMTVNSSPYAVGFYHKVGFKDTDEAQKKDGIIFTPMEMIF